MNETTRKPLPPAGLEKAPEPGGRRPYTPPRLELLGAWSALTLQQSVPIYP